MPDSIPWNAFLSVQAGAPATLTGLVFVAVSINLSRIMTVPGLPGRAAESIVQFLQVFLTAAMALIPRQPEWVLGVEILSIGAVSWIVQAAGQIRYLRQKTGHPWSWFVDRAVLSQLATVPLIVAGFALLPGMPGALYWLVPGFVFPLWQAWRVRGSCWWKYCVSRARP